jgi:hypothetical protein
MVSVVLPCRNQADHIGDILPRYLEPLESLGVPFELVVVPNASTDATHEIVEGLAARDDRIRVVPNASGGWGLSVRTGLDAARGGVLAYTNTARTEPASVVEYVRLFFARAGACVVKARRQTRNAPLREAGSFLYNLQARTCFGIRSGDVNGTPKVFDAALYHSLNLQSTGDLLDLELLAGAVRRRVPVVEIPVRGFRRHGGKSSTNWKSALKMYGGAMRLWLSRAG